MSYHRPVLTFYTEREVTSAVIPSHTNVIATLGRDVELDWLGQYWVRAYVPPIPDGAIRSADGTYWRPSSILLQPRGANAEALAGLIGLADRGIYFTGPGQLDLFTLTAAGRNLLDDANAAAMRTTLGLVIGTNVQAQSSKLQAIHNLTWAADKLLRLTGTGSLDTIDFASGTYSPEVSGGTTPGTYTYTNQAGRYIRIGPLVLVEFTVAVNAVSSAGTGVCRISLPIAPAANDRGYGGLSDVTNALGLPANFGGWALRPIASATAVNVRALNTATGAIANAAVNTIVGAGTQFIGSIAYMV